jgi:hypothetical protein
MRSNGSGNLRICQAIGFLKLDGYLQIRCGFDSLSQFTGCFAGTEDQDRRGVFQLKGIQARREFSLLRIIGGNGLTFECSFCSVAGTSKLLLRFRIHDGDFFTIAIQPHNNGPAMIHPDAHFRFHWFFSCCRCYQDRNEHRGFPVLNRFV